MSHLGELYSSAFEEYKKCFPKISGIKNQANFIKIWENEVKIFKKKGEKIHAAKSLLKKYQEKFTAEKAYRTLNFFPKKSNNNNAETINENISSKQDGGVMSSTEKKSNEEPGSSEQKILDSGSSSHDKEQILKIYKTPSQDKVSKEIVSLEIELDRLIKIQKAGLLSDSDVSKISKLQEEISVKKKKFTKLVNASERQKKLRDRKKNNLQIACDDIPDLSKRLKMKSDKGRPRLEVEQPELLKVISELATFGASADSRRRCEVLRTCKTLDDLRTELINLGFTISRSATYLRLQPRKSNSIQGKKHINTVPVRLARPQNDLHSSHEDQKFCTATIRSLETLASILGPEQTIFISQDDKARVPLGITAANKQAPILMHLEYRVRLPDHDWVVASRHKLIPSVYAGIVIQPELMGHPEAVSYSGPTYIAIRSGKHSGSTASTHAADLQKIFHLESFRNICVNNDNKIKPIFIASVDGGPDENPRYEKNIKHAIQHFKDHDLDACYIFTNAPGRSAYNRVERRMAPLSKQLSGVILEHDHFGSHLDNKNNTKDEDLELKNFGYAGRVLAEVWNELIIDKHEVNAEYIEPGNQELPVPDWPSQEWYCNHVRESQYLLQIVKCNDIRCCKVMRSDLLKILPDRFLLPPYPIMQTKNGIVIPPYNLKQNYEFASLQLRLFLSIKPISNFKNIPYDFYCSSLQNHIEERVCEICSLYFATKKNLKSHKRHMHGKKIKDCEKVKPISIISTRAEEILCQYTSNNNTEIAWMPKNDVDISNVSFPKVTENAIQLPVIKNVSEWLENDFEDEIN